jgi:hypothetical protein
MKTRALTKTIILVFAVGLVASMQSYHWGTMSGDPTRSSQAPADNSREGAGASFPEGDSSTQEKFPPPPSPPPPPPSPPFSGTAPLKESPPELRRSLVGVSSEQLRQIGRYLPEGAQIYSSAVGATGLKAALVQADLDGNNIAETIIVHTERSATPEEPRAPLVLSVLVREGARLKVQRSLSLIGAVLFNVEVDGVITPLAVRDVTGDGHPEIIVASGGSPSLGGWLQAFDVRATVFRRVAYINGRYFRVQGGVTREPHVITARWMEEDEPTSYRWNGQEFER